MKIDTSGLGFNTCKVEEIKNGDCFTLNHKKYMRMGYNVNDILIQSNYDSSKTLNVELSEGKLSIFNKDVIVIPLDATVKINYK